MNRRQFLRRAAGLPLLMLPAACRSTEAMRFSGVPIVPACQAPTFEDTERWNKVLVLVELAGGNDGLNTVVPYSDANYHDLRPTKALARENVIQLDERLGFNSLLEPLLPLWKSCQMAVALGVGYPGPNFSHFRSIDIWDTASGFNEFLSEGWISRLFAEARPPAEFAADAVVLGRNAIGPVKGKNIRTAVLNNPNLLKVAKRMRKLPMAEENPALAHLTGVQTDARHAARVILEKHLEDVELGTEFPEDAFGQQMEIASRLIVSSSPVPVIKTAIKGFDTHAGQSVDHPELLASLANGLAAFVQTVKAKGHWDRVLVMTYSEFGRRPKENDSDGTDHGTSAPHFLMGGRVRGGFYGEQPPLDDLVARNLKHRLHFRSLYATAAREWWGLKADFIKEKGLGCIA